MGEDGWTAFTASSGALGSLAMDSSGHLTYTRPAADLGNEEDAYTFSVVVRDGDGDTVSKMATVSTKSDGPQIITVDESGLSSGSKQGSLGGISPEITIAKVDLPDDFEPDFSADDWFIIYENGDGVQIAMLFVDDYKGASCMSPDRSSTL